MVLIPQRLTLEEFLKLPEEKPALEFIDGEVTQKVSPKGQHSLLQLRTTNFINALTEPAEVALALPELRTTFGGASPVPDVSVYLWDRLPQTAAGDIGNDFVEPPDVAIEIVSPDQSVAGLTRRCHWYTAQGAKAALLIHPERRWVRHFRPGQPPITLSGDDVIDLTEVLPGVQIVVARLFGALQVRRRGLDRAGH